MLMLAGFVSRVGAAEPSVETAARQTIRTCRGVLTAGNAGLNARIPVEVKGLITFVEPEGGLLFVQDETAGIFVYTTSLDLKPLRAGMEVFVQGVAQDGQYSPVITATQVTAGAMRTLPVPERVTVGQILSGEFDSQWVSFSGIVRRDGHEWVHRVLEVHDGRRFVKVHIQESSGDHGPGLLDARVTVCGVCAHLKGERGNPGGFAIFVPGRDCVKIVEPPVEDRFAAPLVAARSLGGWHGFGRQEHLVRVRGIVAFQQPGSWLAIQSGGEPLVVQCDSTNLVTSGQEVDVSGWISKRDDEYILDAAQWRETGGKAALAPHGLDNSSQLDDVVPGELVRVRAILLNSVRSGQPVTRAAFRVGDRRTLDVIVRDGLKDTDWQSGAAYELTGVVTKHSSDYVPEAGELTLWLANVGGARLVAAADVPSSDWFGVRDTLWLLLFLVAAAAWWMQHRRQRSILDEMESTLAFNRAQLARAESETARIARDLHDGVIQSIYAVGMRLEECRRLTDTAPKAAGEKLATTSEVLNHVIRDVRSFLTGLEATSIQGRELKTALKSVLLGLGDDAADRIALNIDSRTAELLTSKEATELFHLCKEAISNCLRHSGAARVEVGLQPTRGGWRMEISDNGCGFNPAAVPGDSRGLHNLRVRARNLGAPLQLETAPGQGTRLVVQVPKP